ncbi:MULTISPECIES: TetR/AcrR family transcriptional regulator [unclassified Corynebacterium]|uniref:TetR/AcrR family transcriptional regulator n=1 Tax=unclassified Corynebacterium TaxID=2624378 RepID=UPI001FEFA655|nr:MULTISPECIES: TetR/AcrR family transcriptional regulator [unclassified Corynebacterium]
MNMFNEQVQLENLSVRRQAQKEATQKKVLHAAHTLFIKNGYANTSIRDIATHAGVSVGTVMGVGNKRSILIKTIGHSIQEIHEEIHGESTDLLSVITPFLTMFTGHEELSRAFGAALIEESDHSETLTSLKQLLLNEIQSRLSNSTLSAQEATEFGEILYHTYLGLLIEWAAGLHNDEELHVQAQRTITRLETAFGVSQ